MVSTKTESELSLMRYAGKVAYETLNLMESLIHEGVTTKHLDIEAEKFIRSKNCTPSCLGYEGFPSSICASINDEVVHAIPSNRKLKSGDIITIDLVVTYKGCMADTARTYKVGHVSKEKSDLLKYTEEALYKGLSVIKPGIILNDVCTAIESVAKEHNYGVIRELTGHGIGKYMHEDPDIPNYSNSESNLVLKQGMTLAIEPMFSLHSRKVWMLEDGWTITTQDGSPAAHFEHTIVVTDNGYEILTGE